MHEARDEEAAVGSPQAQSVARAPPNAWSTIGSPTPWDLGAFVEILRGDTGVTALTVGLSAATRAETRSAATMDAVFRR